MKLKKSTLRLALIMAFALTFGKVWAEDGDQSLKASPRAIDKDKRCPVCNMYPARYPQLQAQIIFKDASYHAFDGCKDMFKFLLHIRKYDKMHSRKDVAKAWVKDFNNGEWIEAEKAYYVIGSNLMGAMGKEIVPFEDHMGAMGFHGDRGGEIVRFVDVTMDLLETMDRGKKPMRREKKKHKH